MKGVKGLKKLTETVVCTKVPSLYTIGSLDANVDLSQWGNIAKSIFSAKPKYVSPAEFKHDLPRAGVPEVAFIGRSNVGKSSLISGLLGQKKLVKVSKEPGCTKSINFYTFTKGEALDQHMLYLVDLPGYGFAKISQEEKRKWADIIKNYISSRHQDVLRRVFILVDARHGIKDSDVDMMNQLTQAAVPHQIILTKTDLVTSPQALQQSLESAFTAVMSKQGLTCMPFIHTVSAVSSYGIQSLKLGLAEISAQKWSKENYVTPDD